MSSALIRFAAAGFIAAAAFLPSGGFAQETPAPPATQTPASPPSTPAAPPAVNPVPSSSAATPQPATPEPAKPTDQTAPSGDASTGQVVDLSARPFAYVEGKADRDEIYPAILSALGVVKREMDQAGLAPGGRPIAVFIESDDTGFKFHAGYPLTAAPGGKTSLSDNVKIGQTPSGKAMRFEHDGAYSDIDATYDAITAYLDDKGVDAQDSFVEEYANDVRDPDDPKLQVNIYVLLK